jgi:hypothetical protein
MDEEDICEDGIGDAYEDEEAGAPLIPTSGGKPSKS